jgi:hypothetical protein
LNWNFVLWLKFDPKFITSESNIHMKYKIHVIYHVMLNKKCSKHTLGWQKVNGENQSIHYGVFFLSNLTTKQIYTDDLIKSVTLIHTL